MDTETILAALDQQGHHKVKVGAFDVDGILRAKLVSTHKLRSALDKGLGFCDVVFGWDMVDVLYED